MVEYLYNMIISDQMRHIGIPRQAETNKALLSTTCQQGPEVRVTYHCIYRADLS